MGPFLAENQFRLVEVTGGFYRFQHEEDSYAYIDFNLSSWGLGIETSIMRRNEKDMLPDYPLTFFMKDPPKGDPRIIDGWWKYDTEEDLVGLLEEQANILSERGFAWIHNKLDLNIDEIIDQKATDAKKFWDGATEDEREALLEEYRRINQEWHDKRFKPKKWKLNK